MIRQPVCLEDLIWDLWTRAVAHAATVSDIDGQSVQSLIAQSIALMRKHRWCNRRISEYLNLIAAFPDCYEDYFGDKIQPSVRHIIAALRLAAEELEPPAKLTDLQN